jgi:hypothetical protein
MNVARMTCQHIALNEKLYALDPMNEAVARELAAAIVDFDDFDPRPDDAMLQGVRAAIDEIDELEMNQAESAVQQEVFNQVEITAKQIAMRLLRELAAKHRLETAMTRKAATA